MSNTYKRIGSNTTVTGNVTIDNTVAVSIPPSSDFDPKTLTVTTTPTTLTFSFNPKAILVKAITENPGYVKISKTGDVNFYLLSPGETLSLPIDNTTTIDYYRDAGAGTYQLTVMAVN